MIQDRTGHVLMDVLEFQKQFVLAMYNALEFKFEDNHIMATLRVLGPTNIPSRQVGLPN